MALNPLLEHRWTRLIPLLRLLQETWLPIRSAFLAIPRQASCVFPALSLTPHIWVENLPLHLGASRHPVKFVSSLPIFLIPSVELQQYGNSLCPVIVRVRRLLVTSFRLTHLLRSVLSFTVVLLKNVLLSLRAKLIYLLDSLAPNRRRMILPLVFGRLTPPINKKAGTPQRCRSC